MRGGILLTIVEGLPSKASNDEGGDQDDGGDDADDKEHRTSCLDDFGGQLPGRISLDNGLGVGQGDDADDDKDDRGEYGNDVEDSANRV